MTYSETIEYLYKQLPVFQHIGKTAYKEGLDNTLALDSYFGHPHHKFRTIHVAGTNGKGSTSHLLAAILQSSGYKVGLYTSPHLLDFRERIRVNGAMIEQNFVVDFVNKHHAYYETIHPSFFELTTLMAFTYFAQEEVDFAIVEVGLGGRLDSTNIVTPLLSIITNISLDHTQFLGDTYPKIAYEKAGIIKPSIPVVIGEAREDTRPVFEEKARSVQAPIVFAEDLPAVQSAKRKNGRFIYQSEAFPNLVGELSGYAQLKNANTVLTAVAQIQKLGISIPSQAVYEGFSSVVRMTGLLGRWQVISENPKIVCDTGHNSGGFNYISEQLKEETYDRLHIVFGMVNDKDIRSVLATLPDSAIYYFTKASILRSLDEQDLQQQASLYQLKGNTYNTVEKALIAAIQVANPTDFIFVGGSNFVVAEALAYFKGQSE